MDFKSIFFVFFILLFVFSGCAYQPGIYQSGVVGLKDPDFQFIENEKSTESAIPNLDTDPGRKLPLSQDKNQQPIQTTPDPVMDPLLSEGSTPICENGKKDSYGYEENATLAAANEPAIDVEMTQEKQDRLDEALVLCQEAQDDWKEGHVEMALELLDRAYELLINVEANGNAEIFQQKEDIRFLISKRIVEIYASRQTVLNGKHNEIPLIMNNIVQKEIKCFLAQEREFFLDSYKRSGRYRPMILDELRKAGLPERLSWLPLIESGFLIRALSRARALGLWQFIPSTGYKFGLERNQWIDERMDPVKATRAAIEYLIQLHHIFGDWTTALAAYNCGEGTVLRVIKNQHINYLDNFWDLYAHLPSETARYVPRLMAALYLIENPAAYDLELPPLQDPVVYEEITVKKQVLLSDLATKIGVDSKELRDMNPELRYQVTPDTEYLLKVPVEKAEITLASLEEIPAWKPPEPEFVYHRVRKGETLSHIARRYRTSVQKIARANNIRRYNRLRIGQRLKIPVRRRNKTSVANVKAGSGLKKFRVRKGDCAYDIAKMHGMSLDEFLRVNNLTKRSVIYPGQTVLVRSR